jgi:hypothetical protein
VPVPAELNELQQRGLDSARKYLGLSWQEALARLRSELVGYVREFQAAESRMPDELLTLARFVTAHEQALLEFTTRELDHGGERSLDDVFRLMGQPLT